MRRVGLLMVGGTLLLAGVSRHADAATITVSSAADTGQGTLRAALGQANADSQPDIIVFSNALPKPVLIPVASPLPPLTRGGITLYGDRNGDFAADVALDGSALPRTPASVGLTLASSGNVIRSVALQNFGGPAILISGATATSNVVLGCSLLSNGAGVSLEGGASSNQIGSAVAGDANIFAGSAAGNGVTITGAGTRLNSILSNQIGLNPAGVAPQPNLYGVVINAGAADTLVRGNLISGNTQAGILVESAGGTTTLAANRVGTNNFASSALPNGANGIHVEKSVVVIGGGSSGDGNVISGNNGAGILLSQVPTALVYGNVVGLANDTLSALENGRDGILVTNSVVTPGQLRIGGPTAGQGNFISGNHQSGVHLADAGGVIIQGNQIGLGGDGRPLGNGGSGVLLTNGVSNQLKNNQIGGLAAGESNVISGNGLLPGGGNASLDGVTVRGGGDNILAGNFLGTDRTGAQSAPHGNAGAGARITDGAVNTLLTTNRIWSNQGAGVLIGDSPEPVSRTSIALNAIQFNGASGVRIACGEDTALGGETKANNVIQSNGGDGVFLYWDPACPRPMMRNLLLRNSISGNGGLGIHISASPGATASTPLPNDPGDADTGPNGLMNKPVFQTIRREGDSLFVQGTLDTPNPADARIEFFGNAVADPSGFGEGETYLNEVSPDVDGVFEARFAWDPARHGVITARAADGDNNSSEFSSAVAIPACDSENPGLGDPNGDCVVNITDATLALRIAVGLQKPLAPIRAAADVNRDSRITVADALLILQYATRIITKFPGQ